MFSSPALVHRAMYSGRGIIAPNTEFSAELVDGRGYLPVEWWIMSKTQAKNAVSRTNEGKYVVKCYYVRSLSLRMRMQNADTE